MVSLKQRATQCERKSYCNARGQGYLCQFLYFKLPGGTENSFELWIECARKGEVPNVRSRYQGQNMTEFPFSASDDIPIYDQEHMKVSITGGVRIRGRERLSSTRPLFMKFLAMSETTHTRVALVKNQMIDGAYYADVDISFSLTRGRRSIKCQVDPWGRVLRVERQQRSMQQAQAPLTTSSTTPRAAQAPTTNHPRSSENGK